MQSAANRFANLFGRRSDKAVAVSKSRRRAAKSRLATNFESLESRAMLASDVTIALVPDYTLTIAPLPAGGTGVQAYTYANQFSTLDVNLGGSDDVYIYRQNNRYSFYTDSSLSALSRIQIDIDNDGLDGNDPYDIADGAFASPFLIDSRTWTAGVNTATASSAHPMPFQTISISAGGAATAPQVFVVGGGDNLLKTLSVDLRDSNGDVFAGSAIYVGTPITSAGTAAYGNQVSINNDNPGVAGSLVLAAEAIDLNANVTSTTDSTLRTGGDGTASDAQGITIRRALSVTGGDATIVSSGADVRVRAGGSITGAAGANLNTFVTDLTDASASFAGTIAANTHQFVLRGSALGAATERAITTKDAGTGIQAGTITGQDLFVTLNNNVAGGARDGSIDLNTNLTGKLRIATGLAGSSLDYDVTVKNAGSLLLDSVMSSTGDISIASTTGTISLAAAIDTDGSFSLESQAALTVGSSITSAQNVSLISAAGVTTNAAISTGAAGTGLGIVTITSGTVATINSLVEGASGVAITAGTNIAQGVSSTSLVRAGLATLTAAGSISLNTEVDELQAAAGTSLTIVDKGLSQDATDQFELDLSNVSAAAGAISITADKYLRATNVVATNGPISLTSNEGDVTLGTVVAAGNSLTVSATGYVDADDLDGDADTTEVLGGRIELVDPATLPVVSSIDWTAYHSPGDDFYSNIATVAATLVGSGDIAINSANSVTVTRLQTADGKASVTAAGSIVVNGLGITTALSDNLGMGVDPADLVIETADVTLTAGGNVTVGAVKVGDNNAAVTVVAGQQIGATGTITSNIVALTAGGLASIGSAANRVTLAGLTNIDAVQATVNAGASDVYLASTTAMQLTATAADRVDVLSTGGLSALTIDSIDVTNEDGVVVVKSTSSDVTVDTIRVANGTFGEASSISLSAGRYLVNGVDPIDLQAHSLSLTASTISSAGAGAFDATALDSIVTVSATATDVAGQIALTFDRATDITLGVFSAAGNVAVEVKDTATAASPSLIIGAGGLTAGAGATLSLQAAGGIANTSDAAVTPGTLTAGTVDLTAADGDIVVFTKAGTLVTDGSADVTITQTGNTRIGADNAVAAGAFSLTVNGGAILAGTGSINAATASVSASAGITLATSVGSLVATSTNAAISITEANGLSLGAGGINAGSGDVTLKLTAGNLTGGGELITGNKLAIRLLAAGNLDTDTSGSSLSASTVDGTIELRNVGGFSIGADGIVADDGTSTDAVYKDVILTSTGAVTAGSGTVKADGLDVTAAGAIGLTTTVDSLTALTTLGNVAITQKDVDLVVTSIRSDAGSVSATSNKKISVTEISAGGSGSAVTLTTSGTSQDIVLSNDNAILANGVVTLTASGAIDGTRDVFQDPTNDPTPIADITGATIILQANAGAIDTTVAASSRLSAKTLGTANDAKITLIGTKSVLVGTGASQTFLAATGGLELTAVNTTVLDGDDQPTGNNIVVLTQPVAASVTYETLGDVAYVVTSSSLSSSGSLFTAMDNANAAGNASTFGGTTSVVFSASLNSPIQLTGTRTLTNEVSIDGTRRIDPTTGNYTVGRRVDIDGSRLTGAGLYGFKFAAGSDDSTISGLSFYGFNRTGGGAVQIDGADDVTIQNSSFGITSTGRIAGNKTGISVLNADGTTIDSNTIVKNTVAGISLGADADNTSIIDNTIGTNSTRVNYGNAIGIDLNGAGSATTTIDGNFVAFNTTAGIQIGSDADGVDITGNEVLLNGSGIKVLGTAKNVDILGNTLTRNTGDGVFVTEGASLVDIGTTNAGEGNYIGTTATGAAGLGNRLSGVRINSTGANITVVGNVISGNGVTNRTNAREGVNIDGATPSVSVTSNTISLNRGNGVRVSGSTAVIAKNRVFANYGSGVLANGGSTVTVGKGKAANDGEADGNVINTNSRYAIEVSGATSAQASGNSMTGNRLGGVLNVAAAPIIRSATISGGVLTVKFSAVVAATTQVHLYLGGGTGTTSQGVAYVGRVLGAGTDTITLALDDSEAATKDLNTSVSSRVKVGVSVTATLTTTGNIVSKFASNTTVRQG
jgi:parallel beta-helix repeat protein